MNFFRITIWILAALICEMTVNGLDRKITTKEWPNCELYLKSCEKAKEEGMNVVYSKAVHETNDNLHYAFSTVGAPTILMARTTGVLDINMIFNWDIIASGAPLKDAVKFSGDKAQIHYMFAIAFTKLIEFDDVHDNADLPGSDKAGDSFNIVPFEDFMWLPVDGVKKDEFVFKSPGTNTASFGNGTLSLSFAVRGTEGRNTALPRLKYTANVTQFDFALDGIPPTYNNSRFAVEVMLASLSTDSMSVDQTRSIDDEYAPGVFLITDWKTHSSTKEPTSGFMQWKPVAYFAKDRERKVVTKVQNYKLDDISETNRLNHTLVYGLFGDDLWVSNKVLHKATNVSFGLSKDGFYNKNNYTVWSVAVGYGTPPQDEVSTTVMIIIACGLGLPVIIIIFGSIYMCIKKIKGNGQQYEVLGGGTGVSHDVPQVN